MSHQLYKSGIYMILLLTLVVKSISTNDELLGEIFASIGIILGAFATQDLKK